MKSPFNHSIHLIAEMNSLKYTVVYKYTENHFKCIVSTKSLLDSGLLEHYDRQRPPSPERVQQLVVHFNRNLQRFGEPKFLGDIIICQKVTSNLIKFGDSPQKDNRLYIIDGQHRFGAMCNLIKSGVLVDFDVPVEVLLVQSDADIQVRSHLRKAKKRVFFLLK